jgi:uncharacterized membrane protein YqgA involved in biofilm formation
MTGTILNAGAIILGGLIGTYLGVHLSEKLRNSVFLVLGVFTLAFGLQMFLKTENPLIPLISLVIGVLVGEWLEIEEHVSSWVKKLEGLFAQVLPNNAIIDSRFMKGFISSSMLFCVGPMNILGALQNGLSGDISTLSLKSVLDGFGSLVFASSLGLGVVFSSIPVFIYQGAISLFAVQAQNIFTFTMINEFTAVGGIVLCAIAISGFLEIKHIRTTNFLPALFFAPIITWLFHFI